MREVVFVSIIATSLCGEVDNLTAIDNLCHSMNVNVTVGNMYRVFVDTPYKLIRRYVFVLVILFNTSVV